MNSVPEPQITVFDDVSPLPSQGASRSRRTTASPVIEPPLHDLRWMRVEEWIRAKSLAANSQRAYRKELAQFWKWTTKPWNEITPLDISSYKHFLEKQTIVVAKTGANQPRFSANSIAAAIRALKSFFGWLRKSYYIAENPTLGVSLPQKREVESKDLNAQQIQAIFAALDRREDSQLRDIVLIEILSHGLRAEEASQLNLGDYDQIRLHIREAKHDSTGTVPLRRLARDALDLYLNWRTARGETLTPETPLLINFSRNTTVRGQRLGYNGIYRTVKDLGYLAIEVAVEQALQGLPEPPTHWQIYWNGLHSTVESPKPLTDAVETRKIGDLVGWDIAELINLHPHRFRHTFASMLVGHMDTFLAMALTRHRSQAAFQQYSDRARRQKAEQAFYQMLEETTPEEN